MTTLRYIQAGDLHLDAPFAGISQRMLGRVARKLQESTFSALKNLETFCLEQKPDFLVLTGDITNSEEQSIRARLALVKLCTALEEADIPVFIIHGNHDPLESTPASLSLPHNVTVFGKDVSHTVFKRHDQAVAVIHGLSQAHRQETRNTSQFFSRDQEHHDCFQLGLLHCSVNLPEDSGVPSVNLSDLSRTGLDAWALGHIHKPAVLSKKAPFVAYAGSIQGLKTSEDGDHGCYLVSASRENDGWNIEATFHPLAPVIWRSASVDVSNLSQINILMKKIEEKLTVCRSEVPSSCSMLLVHLILTGQTNLDRDLRKGTEDILHEFDFLSQDKPELIIHDLTLETSPCINVADYRARDDLLGATLREAQHLARMDSDSEDFFQKAMAPLFENTQLRRLLGTPDQEHLMALLHDAEQLCIAHMEEGRVH